MSYPLLDICSIKKIYPGKTKPIEALKGVSLQLHKGEIIGLLGVNGAGKTTLSSIIATLIPPTSGDILFKGVSIYKNLIEYRKALGFCPQRANFEPMLTVEENIVFAGRYYGIAKDVIQERSKKLMDQFELTQYAQQLPTELSGGYKQRLLIARSLMHNPSLIILDEPTVAMDPHIRRELWQKIRELKELGVTVVLTTHYLDEAEELSDRVCILHKGLIEFVGTSDELKSTYQKTRLEEVFLHLVESKNETNNKD